MACIAQPRQQVHGPRRGHDQICVQQLVTLVGHRPDCSVRNPGLQPGATVTRTAACADGAVEGTGMLTWTVTEGTQAETGRLEDSRQAGHWILRWENGERVDGQ